MIPIGRGQRELLSGTANGNSHCHRYHHQPAGKLPERRSCVLHLRAIGRKVPRLLFGQHIEKHGAMDYTVVLKAGDLPRCSTLLLLPEQP